MDDGVLLPHAVVFAHGVNNKAKLEAALADPAVNFLEADVIFREVPSGEGGQGSGTGTMRAVMGHDATDPFDLTFDEFAKQAACKGKGLKVDLKMWSAVEDVLSVLQGMQSSDAHEDAWPLLRVTKGHGAASAQCDVPALIINADVLTGTEPPALDFLKKYAPGCLFNPSRAVLSEPEQRAAATAFVTRVLECLPFAIMSIGWTTYGDYDPALHIPTGHGPYASFKERAVGVIDYFYHFSSPPQRRYERGHCEGMREVALPFAQMGVVFTFPVRASYVRSSWWDKEPSEASSSAGGAASVASSDGIPGPLQMLVRQCPGSTLTLWSPAPLSEQEEQWLRANLPSDTFYDLPPRPTSTSSSSSSSSSRSDVLTDALLHGHKHLPAWATASIVALAAVAILKVSAPKLSK
jgi:hypothetical protein